MGAREDVLVVPRDILFGGSEWTGFRSTGLDELLARVRANYRFHDVIYDACGAPSVAAQAKAARRTFAGGQTWIARGELDDLYARNDAQHRAIRNALAARSAAGARALATEHVHSSYELLLAILDHVDRQAVTLRRTSA